MSFLCWQIEVVLWDANDQFNLCQMINFGLDSKLLKWCLNSICVYKTKILLTTKHCNLNNLLLQVLLCLRGENNNPKKSSFELSFLLEMDFQNILYSSRFSVFSKNIILLLKNIHSSKKGWKIPRNFPFC